MELPLRKPFFVARVGQQATRKQALSEEIKSDNDGLCYKICGACVS
jgi:hypothetical protein